MTSLETARLRLRPFTLDDAEFVLRLVNDPDWLRYIGDKGVRDAEGARRYLADGPLASYARHGFGLLAVEPIEGGDPIGTCGLLKRDTLPDPDIGFAFVPGARGHGYAAEAAGAVLEAALAAGIRRVLAITSPDNARSIALLAKAGFRFEREAALARDTPPVRVYALSG